MRLPTCLGNRLTAAVAGSVLAGLVLVTAACQPFRPPIVPITPASTAVATGTSDADVAARVTQAMTAASVRDHLVELQRIADAHGGNRAAGSPGYDASVEYVRDRLTAAGYRVQLADFTFTRTTVLAESAAVTVGGSVPLAPRMMQQSPSLPGSVTAELRVAVKPLGCSADDYADARGAIVLAQRGTCTLAAKSKAAAQAGAVALLIFDANNAGTPWQGTLVSSDGMIPTATLTGDEGRGLQQALSAGPVQLQLDLRSEQHQVTNRNVIADWPTGDPAGRVVMVGGHLDSVPAGPGINDNGSGVALVLRLAEVLAAQGSAGRLQVGFWGAEELGLVGSRAWVDSLSEADRGRIASYLNFDMVASPNGEVAVYGAGPPKDALEKVFGEVFGTRPAEVDLNGASDHASFADKGIPVAGIFTGAGEPDAAGRPFDPCYHQRCDTLESVSGAETLQRLDLIADATALAVLTLLRTLD